MFIDYRPESTILPRTAPGFIEFPSGTGTGCSVSFFVNSNQTYTGVIRSVTYNLRRLSDNASVSWTTGGDATVLTQFTDDYLRVAKSTTTDGIKITMNTAMPAEAKLYQLTATVSFTSGKVSTAQKTIVV
jgi:hypothetical protein